MITEDYVSFETAKLLKEKGFDEICYLGYNKNGEYVPTSNRTNSQIIQPDFCFICCPTLQMAMKWLREVHNLNINVIYDLQTFVKTDGTKDYINVYEVDIITKNGTIYIGNYNHYESGCEAALNYCLTNLIK